MMQLGDVHWCWGHPSGRGDIYGWVVSLERDGKVCKQFLIGFCNK